MKTQMLSAVADPVLKDELRSLFNRYPFDEMSAEFSRAEDCAGITFADCTIYILPDNNSRRLLSIYLHEVAHATLIQARHPRGFDHGYDFVQSCRKLQLRFGVSDQAWHNYDQQDSPIKTTHAESVMRAQQSAKQAIYNPALEAISLAESASSSEVRHEFRRGAIILAPIGLVYVAFFTDWQTAVDSLNRGDIMLCSGLALAGFLWFNLRGRD